MAKEAIVLLCVLVSVVSSYQGPDLPPGPFCGIDNRCCVNRQDDCSHKILDTVCYCDEFCDRSHDDCCPDYEPVCKGIQPSPPPAPITYPCDYGGRSYLLGQTRMDDCRTCTCSIDETDQNPLENVQGGRWKCDPDPCVNSEDVVRAVSRPGNSWRAHAYTQFKGKKLKHALLYKLGTLPLDSFTRRMGAIYYGKDIAYPEYFDARQKWANYISPVVDQGWCGSDWAVTIATIASDRLAIQSNGAEREILSPQTLLSCNQHGQQGCDGGHIDIAWNFARNFGLVDEECFPYKATTSRCPFRTESTLREDGCRPSTKQRLTRYRVGPVSRLRKEKDIMYDIMTSGPVHAIMTVYQDFFHYRDGVYRRSRSGNNKMSGLHSVRILGWGEDDGIKYWLAANSWGTEWGENGYFRIARGENESGIESFVVTALSEVSEANQTI